MNFEKNCLEIRISCGRLKFIVYILYAAFTPISYPVLKNRYTVVKTEYINIMPMDTAFST